MVLRVTGVNFPSLCYHHDSRPSKKGKSSSCSLEEGHVFLLALLGLALADHVSFYLAIMIYLFVLLVLFDRATEPFAESRKKWWAAGWFFCGGLYLLYLFTVLTLTV